MINDEVFIYPRPDLFIYLLNPCDIYFGDKLSLNLHRYLPWSVSIGFLMVTIIFYPLVKIRGMSQAPRDCFVWEFLLLCLGLVFSPLGFDNENSVDYCISMFYLIRSMDPTCLHSSLADVAGLVCSRFGQNPCPLCKLYFLSSRVLFLLIKCMQSHSLYWASCFTS